MAAGLGLRAQGPEWKVDRALQGRNVKSRGRVYKTEA